jgi:hypothetical protein
MTSEYNMLNELIGKYHPEVADIYKNIGIVFKEGIGKSGGKYVFSKVAKAPPIVNVMCNKDKPEGEEEKEYIYIIYIYEEAWGLMNTEQRKALMDRCLCSIKQKYDEKSDKIKYLLVKEDIVAYKAELSRHGYWWGDIETQLEELHKKPEDDEEGEEDNQRMKSSGPAIDEGKVEDILSDLANEDSE